MITAELCKITSMPSRGPLIPTFTFDAWFFMQLAAVLFSKINVMSQQSRGDTFDEWPFSHGDDICEGRGDVRCVDILLERNLIKINIFKKLKKFELYYHSFNINFSFKIRSNTRVSMNNLTSASSNLKTLKRNSILIENRISQSNLFHWVTQKFLENQTLLIFTRSYL